MNTPPSKFDTTPGAEASATGPSIINNSRNSTSEAKKNQPPLNEKYCVATSSIPSAPRKSKSRPPDYNDDDDDYDRYADIVTHK